MKFFNNITLIGKKKDRAKALISIASAALVTAGVLYSVVIKTNMIDEELRGTGAPDPGDEPTYFGKSVAYEVKDRLSNLRGFTTAIKKDSDYAEESAERFADAINTGLHRIYEYRVPVILFIGAAVVYKMNGVLDRKETLYFKRRYIMSTGKMTKLVNSICFAESVVKKNSELLHKNVETFKVSAGMAIALQTFISMIDEPMMETGLVTKR